MNRRAKYLIGAGIFAVLLLTARNLRADAYVGSVFSYTYENQTLTYKVLSEPTETENGTAAVIYDKEGTEKLKGDLVIPPAVKNKNMPYDVIQVEGDAFTDAVNITSVNIPAKVNFIGAYAFNNCSSLVSINIPKGITGIENGTFYGCKNLENISLPDQITYIGRSAFTECEKLTSLTLPAGVKSIGTSAFADCTGLISINIPEGVPAIEDKTFQNCFNLTEAVLPESITRIGSYAFYNCGSLKVIHLSDEITAIGQYAFYSCTGLTSIKIPAKVTKIENRTFLNCTGLTKIRIPDNVTSIGDFAFYNNSSLISLKLPGNLTTIGMFAFTMCDNLRPLTIPASVTKIGEGKYPYTGVWVYRNSYAEDYFAKNYPEYYQIINLPLEEMFFEEQVMNIEIGDTDKLKPVFYPAFSSDIRGTIQWTSSDAQAVSVDSNGNIKGIAKGEADITATMGNFKATVHIIAGGETINPTDIKLSDSYMKLKKGDSARLSVTFTPAQATNQSVKWISSDTSVVTVDKGVIYAKGVGKAIVRAVSGSLSAESEITVYNPLKEIYSDYDVINLNKGESRKIAISFDPVDTTDSKTIFWSSSDTSVVTVEDGNIKAIKPGKATVTASVGTFTHNIPVQVFVPAKSVSFSQTAISFTSGQKASCNLIILPEDTTDPLTITSLDPAVATYEDGMIIAKKRGQTTIKAVSGSLSASLQVTVVSDIKAIALNKKNLNLYFGQSETLTVTFTPAQVFDDKTITWSSSNRDVVSVDSKGKLKTTGIGTATVTAMAGDKKKAAATVTIKLALPLSFQAVSGGVNSNKITWKTVSGASGYQLYRADSKTGTYTLIKDTGSKAFTDKGLVTGKTYYYKVRAYRQQGMKKVYGSFTDVVAAKPVPPVPSNVKLIKVSSGRISFTWNKVSSVSGYEVYRSSSKTRTFGKVKTTASLYFINYGLTKERTYYYKVRAYKIVGGKKVYGNFTKVFSVKI
jgi:uncharacterized protein YjdB